MQNFNILHLVATSKDSFSNGAHIMLESNRKTSQTGQTLEKDFSGLYNDEDDNDDDDNDDIDDDEESLIF